MQNGLTEQMKASPAKVRLTEILAHLGLAPASWYRKRKPSPPEPPTGSRRGPQPKEVEEWKIEIVLAMAWSNPWYGYKRIAVMCRRAGREITDREAYRIMKKWNLLQREKPREAEIYQARKLFELLPSKPNDLWQMDVTYIHIAGYGWHYAVTVIDYFSRYLLAAHLTTSYSAMECTIALGKARAEAERLCGKLEKPVFLVTDNGSSFLARRFGQFIAENSMTQVRIQYRTPQQLGLLERFHQTLKKEEVYWNLYESPAAARRSLELFRERYNMDRPHWALRPTEGGDPLVPWEVYVKARQVVLPKWQGWAKAAKKKLDELFGERSAEAACA